MDTRTLVWWALSGIAYHEAHHPTVRHYSFATADAVMLTHRIEGDTTDRVSIIDETGKE